MIMFAGGAVILLAVIRGPDAPWCRALVVAGIALMTVSFFTGPKHTRSGGGECYTDWDGRSNSTVCD